MIARYVWADLVRNPRRTLSTAVGVMLGVGFSCAILFFVDGLSASMTHRAVAPLAIDMQRVLTEPLAGGMRLGLEVSPAGPAKPGDVIQVRLKLQNDGRTPANEVVVRSVPAADLAYLEGSATVDGKAVAAKGESPFASGPAKIGLNVGTVEPGATVLFAYRAAVSAARDISAQAFASTFSTREALAPVPANAPAPMGLSELATRIGALDGVTSAQQLSFADFPPGAHAAGAPADGPARVFGFDPGYTRHDATIKIVKGSQVAGEAMISAEAAASLSVGIGDSVSLTLPDGAKMDARISGIVDLTRARSLFSSRQGADLETFVYVPNALIVDSASFASQVVPAYERAAAGRGERVKSPPVREIDIGIDRKLLDAEPGIALVQTQRIAGTVSGVAGGAGLPARQHLEHARGGP